ncbi:ArsR/SmtB family transcription factor [Halorientalis halophila]|uniref:ArsR/SmtB family transcription factor n=1 Tax=Halorientalis halophila TaxID=3108499 RepID=UPI00300AE1EC
MTTNPRPRRHDHTTTLESPAEKRPSGKSGQDHPEEFLDLFGDEYTRLVLEAVLEEPMSGADVADATGISRATAFRRLNELVDYGLVATSQYLDTDGGHHHKQYCAVIDRFSVTFDEDGLQIVVETESTAERQSPVPTRVPADD